MHVCDHIDFNGRVVVNMEVDDPARKTTHPRVCFPGGLIFSESLETMQMLSGPYKLSERRETVMPIFPPATIVAKSEAVGSTLTGANSFEAALIQGLEVFAWGSTKSRIPIIEMPSTNKA